MPTGLTTSPGGGDGPCGRGPGVLRALLARRPEGTAGGGAALPRSSSMNSGPWMALWMPWLTGLVISCSFASCICAYTVLSGRFLQAAGGAQAPPGPVPSMPTPPGLDAQGVGQTHSTSRLLPLLCSRPPPPGCPPRAHRVLSVFLGEDLLQGEVVHPPESPSPGTGRTAFPWGCTMPTRLSEALAEGFRGQRERAGWAQTHAGPGLRVPRLRRVGFPRGHSPAGHGRDLSLEGSGTSRVHGTSGGRG